MQNLIKKYFRCLHFGEKGTGIRCPASRSLSLLRICRILQKLEALSEALKMSKSFQSMMQMNKGNFQYFFVWFGFGYHLSLNLLNSTEENSEVFSSCLLFKSLKLLFWSDAVMILLQTWCLEIHRGITAICLLLLYIFFLQVVFGCNCVCVGVRICPCLVVLLLIFRPCLCY